MRPSGDGSSCATGVQAYEYAVISEPDSAVALPWEVIEVDGQREPLYVADPDENESEPEAEEPCQELERDFAEENRLHFELGRAQGIEEGKRAEREGIGAAQASAAAARLAEVTGAIARMMESFEAERDRYMKAVEREAVKLATAVAARILRREAQMDPLLLLGAVRVALGQLSDTTEVRLRVPPSDVELWSEAVRLLPAHNPRPQVAAGEGMRLGDCMMETELGTVDLGVRAQMGEIERGFFDRAAAAAEAQKAVAAEPAA